LYKYQKRGEVVGLDGRASEAYLYDGINLHIHLCLLFNLFSTCIPIPVVQAMIIFLVKCKRLTFGWTGRRTTHAARWHIIAHSV